MRLLTIMSDRPRQTEDYNRIAARWGMIQTIVIIAIAGIGWFVYNQLTILADEADIVSDKVDVFAQQMDVFGKKVDVFGKQIEVQAEEVTVYEQGSSEEEPVVEPLEDTPTPDPTSSPTSAPALDDQREPSITVVGGTRGPSDPDDVRSGRPCHDSSINCRHVRYQLTDFDTGVYEFTCWHDGWNNLPSSSFGGVYEIAVDREHTGYRELACFINFNLLTGERGVSVIARGPKTVGEDGSVTYVRDFISNWTKEVIDLSTG